MAVLREQLRIGGERWERSQVIAAVRGLSGAAKERCYRIVIAARGELDLRYQHQVDVLFLLLVCGLHCPA